MSWTRTLRGRLTLWNLGVIAITLTLFGLSLTMANHRRLELQIDRDLVDRAMQFARGPRMRLGPPPAGAFERRADDRVDLRRPQVFSSTGILQMGNTVEEPYDQALAVVALKGRPSFANSSYKGIPIRVFAVRVRGAAGVQGGQGGQAGQGGVPGMAGEPGGFLRSEVGRDAGDYVVEVAQDMSPYLNLAHIQILTLAIVLPLAILVAGLGALFLTNAALRPIADVTDAASQISEKNLSQRLKVTGEDELAKLSLTFNDMIDRLQTAFRNQRKAYEDLEVAYENQRRFTADASHELRTPLTRMRLATSSALSEKADQSAVAAAIKVADQAAESMSTIVQELLLLAQADAGTLRMQLAPVDLRVVVADAVDSCTAPSRISLNLGEAPVTAAADQEHLKRVILNLLENSLRHTGGGKSIMVSVSESDLEARIDVEDQGEGISREHLPHLGERFFRVDAARSRAEGGFGLGLAICKSIMEAHQGSLSFSSEIGTGTMATVQLPKDRAH